MQIYWFGFWLCAVLIPFTSAQVVDYCFDEDQSGACVEWAQSGFCQPQSYVYVSCRQSCRLCSAKPLPRKYDPKYLPPQLKPLEKFLGRWRSEFDGKAHFPTMPNFTYSEQLDFSVGDSANPTVQFLNYSAVAISNAFDKRELHSESGFLAIQDQSTYVVLSLVMSSGFATVEDGAIQGSELTLKMRDIARVSFNRDLPVTELRRTFRFIDDDTMEQLLHMATLTHPLQEHTYARYKRYYIY